VRLSAGKIAFVLVMTLAACCVCVVTGFGINVSRSMPLGFYQRVSTTHIQRGDTVAACLNDPIAQEGLKQGYLHYGRCPSHTAPVLKKVIALPNDTVWLSDGGITVNHHFYSAPRQGVDDKPPIKRFVGVGKYQGGYWLYGASAPKQSWDSRYFGAVLPTQIIGVYQRIEIFKELP